MCVCVRVRVRATRSLLPLASDLMQLSDSCPDPVGGASSVQMEEEGD